MPSNSTRSRSSTTLRAPFVVTASMALVHACSANPASDPDPVTIPTAGAEPGEPSPSPAPSSLHADATKPPLADGCPAAPPPRFNNCKQSLGDKTCSYRLTCQSGAHDIVFACNDESGSTVQALPCAHEWDECEAGVQCYQGNWYRHEGTNPPPPCPKARPAPGAACRSKGFTREGPCGFFCDDGATWTVATCESSDQWKLDGACASKPRARNRVQSNGYRGDALHRPPLLSRSTPSGPRINETASTP